MAGNDRDIGHRYTPINADGESIALSATSAVKRTLPEQLWKRSVMRSSAQEMADWLAHPMEFGRPPAEVVEIHRELFFEGKL